MCEHENISIEYGQERNTLDIDGVVECYLVVMYVARGFTKTPPELIDMRTVIFYASN